MPRFSSRKRSNASRTLYHATRFTIEKLEERQLLTAVVAPPDPVIWGDTVTGPLAPKPGHSFYVSRETSQGVEGTPWFNDSAITPNTTNDLVMNVSPFATSYVACCEGAGGSPNLLTNGITQNQTAAAPSANQPAVGDGQASDPSNKTNVISAGTALPAYSFSYQLGTAGGATANSTGYDLSEIDVITGHQDFRSAIGSIDILVEPAGSSQFISLSDGRGFSLTSVPDGNGGTMAIVKGGAAQMAIVSSTPGQPIATNVQAVEFVVSATVLNQQTFFRELVVTGAASGSLPASPATPTGVAANFASSSVTVSWNASSNAAGYAVLRSTNSNGPYTVVGSTVNQTTCVDSGVQPNTTYYYEVVASGNGDSAATAPVSVTTSNFSPAVNPAAVVAPTTAPTVSGSTPLAPMPGKTFWVNGLGTSNAWQWNSAITPVTTNDLVLNVTAFSQNYAPCCEANDALGGIGCTGSINSGRLLTNGLTQNQVGIFPSSGQVAASGSGGISDSSSPMSVLSNNSTANWFLDYNLGNYGNFNGSAFVPGSTPSANGYDINEIDVITGHQDTRTGMQVDIMVETVGSNQFYSLSNGQNFSFTSIPSGNSAIAVNRGSAQMAIVSSGSGPIATNIKAIKFVASNDQTWFRELVVSGTASASLPPPIAPPTNVVASISTGGSPTVTWNTSAGAVGYTVARSSTSNGTYTTVGSVTDQTSFTDFSALPNSTYYYEVFASGNGDSALSAPSNAVTTSNTGPTAWLFQNQLWQGAPAITERLAWINYNGVAATTTFPVAPGFNANAFSTFIEGKVTTDLAGSYLFSASTDDDGFLYVNGQLVSSDVWTSSSVNLRISIPITLAATTAYNFVFVEDNKSGPWNFQMNWQEPLANGTAGPLVLVPPAQFRPTADTAAAPQTVNANALSDADVRLNWSSTHDSTSFAYVIQRAPSDTNGNPVGAFTQVSQTFSGPASLGGVSIVGGAAAPNWGISSYDDTTVVAGSRYVYRVGLLMPGQSSPSGFSPTSQVVTIPAAASASLSGGTLSVTLGAYDAANFSVDGSGNLVISSGTTTVFSGPASSVSALNVTGVSGLPVTVNLNSALNFSGGVSITQVSDVTVGAALTAQQLNVVSSNNVTINASITTAGPLTLNADSDENNAGTLLIAAAATIISGNNPVSLHASTLTVNGNVNAGSGSVSVSYSPGFSTSGLPGHLTCSSTVTETQLVTTTATLSDTWGSGVTGTVIYNMPAAAFSTAGISTSAGNANLQIIANTITTTGAINTGTGSLTLSAPTNTIGTAVIAGLVSVPASDTLTLNAPLTASGSMAAAGNVIVNNTTLTVLNGLSFSNGASLTLNSTASAPASLIMGNTETLGGQGQVVFNGNATTTPGYLRVGQNGQAASLTIGPNVSIATGTGSGVIGSGTNGSVISNQGSISAQSAGTGLTILDAIQGNAPTGTVNTPTSVSWSGNGDGTSWTDPNNWAGGQLPGPSTDVTLNPAGNPTIVIASGVQSVRSVNSSVAINITGGELDVATTSQAPSITLSSTATLGGSGSWTLTNLTLQDSCTVNGGNITVNGTLTWNGGTMSGTGVTTVPSGATLTMSGDPGVGHTPSQGLTLARTLNNLSTSATWSGTLGISFLNSSFNNFGVLGVTGAHTATGLAGSNNSTGAFNNAGTLNYSAASSNLWFNTGTGGVLFNNTGSVNVSAGQLIVDHGGTISGPMNIGASGFLLLRGSLGFASGGSITGGGTVTFSGGTYAFGSGQFSPTGVINFTAGTITINAAISPASLGNIGAAVTFNAAVNNSASATILSSGTVNIGSGGSWSPAALSNAGNFNIAAGGTATITGALSGGGNVSVGGASGAAGSLTVGSFAQNIVTVNATGTLTLAANSQAVANTANSLTLAVGAVLSLIPTATLTLPSNATALTLNGGKIIGGTLNTSGSVLITNSSGILDGVTIGSNFNVNTKALTVLDGLTLNNASVTLISNATAPASLSFVNTQSLGGTGQIIFNSDVPATDSFLNLGTAAQPATLTIAAGVSLVTGTGSGVIGSGIAGNRIINQGTISAQTSATSITVLDTLQNQGSGNTVQSNGALLITAVVWTGAGDGTSWTDVNNWAGNTLPGPSNAAVLTLSGSPTIVIASGIQSIYHLIASDSIQLTGGTLAVANRAQVSNLTLAGGTLLGGTYLALNAVAPLSITQNSTVDGVTLNTPLTIGPNIVLHVKDGLMLNSTITLLSNSTLSGPATLQFDGTQSLLGQGSITFNGDAPTTTSQIGLGQPSQSATLTIGPTITISTANAGAIIGGGINGDQIINQGVISASTSGTSITVLDPLTNQGAGSATQSNGGSLNLNTGGALQFTGGTVSVSSPLGDVSAVVVSGGSLNLTSQTPITLPTVTLSGGTLSSTAPVTVSSTANLSGGTIAGAGVVVPIGATATVTGNVVATAPITNTGTVNVSSGTLELDGGGTQDGTFTVATGSALTFGGNTIQTLAADSSITGSGIVQFGGGDTVNVSGAYNIGSTVVLGGAQVTLPAGSTTGTLTMLGGILSIGPDLFGGAAPAASSSKSSGSGKRVTGRPAARTGTGAASPATAAPNLVSVSQEVLDGGTLIIQAGWTLNNSGPTLFGATATINIASDNNSPGIFKLGGDVFFTSSSGTASILATGTGSKPGVVDMGGVTRSFTVNDGSAPIDLSISASLSDGGLRMSGGGWMQLLGNNTYAGGTTVSSGTLETDNASALGSGPLVFSGGTYAPRGVSSLAALSASPTASISIDVGSATIQSPSATLGAALNVVGSGGMLLINGPVTLQGDVTINNSANVEITGAISGPGSVTKTLGGTLTFDGSTANSYSGLTFVDGGTLALNKSSGVAAIPGDLTINGPSTVQLLAAQQLLSTATVHFNSVPGLAVFNLNGQTQSLSQINDTGGGSIVFGGGALTLGATNASSTFGGSLNGAGSLFKSGSGAFLLTGANNFTGAITVNAGTFQVNSFNQSAISIGASGALLVAHLVSPATNTTASLTITPGGKLDISNSTVLINYAGQGDPIATIRGYLSSGYNSGAWNGGGIQSSSAAANAAHTTAIGWADSADGLIASQPANTIELKYTLYGDTTLTGSVGFNDFTRLTQHYNQTSGGAWDTGDFNYDGSVNSADFTLMTRTYNTGLGSQAMPAAQAGAGGSAVAAGTPVSAKPTLAAPAPTAKPVSHSARRSASRSKPRH